MTENIDLKPLDCHNQILLANAHPSDWPNPVPASRYNMLVIGAGHAHLYSLSRLREFVQRGIVATVISPVPFWYSGMGPGLLSGLYEPGEASVDVRAMVENRGGRFVEDRVAMIDAERKCLTTEGGEALFYDVLSLNIGSEVWPPVVAGAAPRVFPVKPVSHFLDLRSAILEWQGGRPLRLLVIGGGPAGCEAAANARALCKRENVPAEIRLITSSGRLLPELPTTAGREMAGWCRENGVDVVTGRRVECCRDGGVYHDNGSFCAADFVIAATGVHTPPWLRGSGLALDEQSALVVDERLRSISHHGVFGGGDGIHFQPHPLDRVGVYAVRQAPVLCHNLLAALCGDNLQVFSPQRKYLLVLNLGDGTGLLVRGGMVVRGRLPLLLKKWLDRRFIEKYQQAVVA